MLKFLKNKTFGSALIVGGTSIGAGMLALPISTGITGLWYALGLLICAFFFMLVTLFLLLEVNLWSKNPTANIISLAKEHLGVAGQFVTWSSFLLLLYSVAAAYLSGGGSLISKMVSSPSHEVPTFVGVFLFMIIFGFIVIFETKALDIFNRIMMVGLIASFFLMLFATMPYVNLTQLTEGSPDYLFAAIPIVVLSFTSHIIVPSIRTYLKNDVKSLKRSLFYGSLIPLFFYILWVMIIIGVIPLSGTPSLTQIAESSQPVAKLTSALSIITQFPWLGILVGAFSFFALVTSFFGVSMSLYDFLADGLKIQRDIKGKFLLLILMFLPPLMFALFYPKGFLMAIGYAGVFVAILYGLIPVFMIWKGRYFTRIKEPFRVPGGRPLLILIFLGALFVIAMQIASTRNWIPHI